MTYVSYNLSVIIITQNRWQKLRCLLEALEKQSISSFEVVVVSDGSEDETNQFLSTYSSDRFNVVTCVQQKSGRSKARNKGAEIASGNLLLFFDDDMIPFSNCLNLHLLHQKTYIPSICVGSQEEDQLGIKNDFDLFRFELSKIWEPSHFDILKMDTQNLYLTAAHFSIPKSEFERLVGFDPMAEVVEDFDFALRANQFEIPIYYQPKARSIHDSKVDCITFIRKQIEYYRSYLNLLVLKPYFSNSFNRRRPYRPGPCKRFVYSLLAQQQFAIWIDKGYFRFIYPKVLRFKLYDIIITGLSRVYPDRFTLQNLIYHGEK